MVIQIGLEHTVAKTAIYCWHYFYYCWQYLDIKKRA